MDPFPHVRVSNILSPAAADRALGWLRTRGPWAQRIESFYEQHEFSLLATELDDKIADLVSPAFSEVVCTELRERFAVAEGLMLVDVVAHRLTLGQTIRIHNDYLDGRETHRLLIQLNDGWSVERGGLLMLFAGEAPESLRHIVMPTHASGFAFENLAVLLPCGVDDPGRRAVYPGLHAPSAHVSTEADLVHAAIGAAGGRWFAGLAAPLARIRWRSVAELTGLTRQTYGTARYLAGDGFVPRDDLTTVSLPATFAASGLVAVETLHGAALRRYADLGLDFHINGATDVKLVHGRLVDAFDRLAEVPPAAAAVGAVLAVLHVARPKRPEYDVSYSDPLLPFSIFVGIDGSEQANGDLRVAEGILHECMHLQLTLIEETVTMVSTGDEQHYSPWQGTMRPSQGVLHGLYVFRVIQDFHRTLLEGGSLTPGERTYLTRRIDTIKEEVASVGDLAASSDLTETGRRLAAALQAA